MGLFRSRQRWDKIYQIDQRAGGMRLPWSSCFGFGKSPGLLFLDAAETMSKLQKGDADTLDQSRSYIKKLEGHRRLWQPILPVVRYASRAGYHSRRTACNSVTKSGCYGVLSSITIVISTFLVFGRLSAMSRWVQAPGRLE
jgi:hypothetical protein